MLLARARFLKCDFEAALRCCIACIKADPTFSSAALLQAQILLRQDKYKQAHGVLEQALSHNFSVRDSPLFHLVKAKVLQTSGDSTEAMQVREFLLTCTAPHRTAPSSPTPPRPSSPILLHSILLHSMPHPVPPRPTPPVLARPGSSRPIAARAYRPHSVSRQILEGAMQLPGVIGSTQDGAGRRAAANAAELSLFDR